MSLNKEFDELARRKLEERQIAFHEADWHDARKLIDAERGGRNRTAWIAGATVLLLMSGLVWYGTRSAKPDVTIAAVDHSEVRSESVKAIDSEIPNSPALFAEKTPSTTNSATLEGVNAPSVRSTTAQSIPVHSVERPPIPESKLNKTTEKNAPRKKADLPTRSTVTATTTSAGTNKTYDIQVAAQNEKEHAAVSTTETAITTTAQDSPAPASNPTAITTPEASIPSSRPPVQAPISTEPDGTGQAENPGVPAIILATTQGITLTNATPSNTTDAMPGTAQPSEGNRAAAGAMPPAEPSDPNVAAQKSSAATAAPTGNTTTQPGSEASLTTAAAAPTTPGDPMNAAVATAATPPPLVPARAPWEVSIIGGMLSSTTKYTGSNSADWKGDSGKENSIGIGAELLHMGRNFGIGTGMHYSTYAEQLHTKAVDHSTTTLHNFWYLMPVDTMVFVVTDTIPGTPPSYMGTSTHTTVDVLAQGTDTSTTTERVREARNEVNHVSYLEIPLLLDAHVVQGRWSFGLRGGPTVGLLTGRRGAIPAPDNEGYLTFADLPFRELIVGYTARAYARYRFNAAWSVGIEPTLQGQLMNSMGSGELDRKVNAKGVMLSLSYRLR